jgi:hypothetical protein
MPQSTRPSTLLLSAVLVVVGASVTCGPAADSSRALEEGIPDEIAGWEATEPVVHYDTESIYDYIDGHAEVYLAYGMKRSLARRYTGPEGEADIVLDLFELASPADAFGVFTHDLDGVPVGIGTGSLLRYGWLSFWQGPWFVSVSSEMESDRASQAVLELGRAVAQLLPAEGGSPPVVEALPTVGLDPRSVRFLRHPQILNTHIWVGDENLFELSPEVAAALGTYQREGESAHLLVVDYASSRVGEQVRAAFARRFLSASREAVPAEVDDRGWYAAQRTGKRLVAVLGAESQELAASLLAEATGEIP